MDSKLRRFFELEELNVSNATLKSCDMLVVGQYEIEAAGHILHDMNEGWNDQKTSPFAYIDHRGLRNVIVALSKDGSIRKRIFGIKAGFDIDLYAMKFSNVFDLEPGGIIDQGERLSERSLNPAREAVDVSFEEVGADNVALKWGRNTLVYMTYGFFDQNEITVACPQNLRFGLKVFLLD